MKKIRYIVREGDTLWSIADQFLGNGLRWHELWTVENREAVRKNQPGDHYHGPDWIFPGTVLMVPDERKYAAMLINPENIAAPVNRVVVRSDPVDAVVSLVGSGVNDCNLIQVIPLSGGTA